MPTIQEFLADPERRPGCYDDSSFAVYERADPSGAIEAYASHVLARSRTAKDDEQIRAVVRHCADRIVGRASPSEIRGRCGALSMSLLRMLERSGLWCFAMQGDAEFRFPSGSGVADAYLHVSDPRVRDPREAGHVWLVVPPFKVVDLTAHFQRWTGREADHLPTSVLAEDATQSPPRMHRPPRKLTDLWRRHPPVELMAAGVRILYQPHAIKLPLDPFEEDDLVLGGRRALKFWEDEVRPPS